jgi:hypothetical protein
LDLPLHNHAAHLRFPSARTISVSDGLGIDISQYLARFGLGRAIPFEQGMVEGE